MFQVLQLATKEVTKKNAHYKKILKQKTSYKWKGSSMDVLAQPSLIHTSHWKKLGGQKNRNICQEK
jgi:hypothetical protein